MALIERDAVQTPVLRKQTEPMPSLGGDVIARGLLLSELLTLSHVQSGLRDPLPDESEEDAFARAGAAMVAKTLHLGIVLADEQPMWTEQQWNLHGANHLVETMKLFALVNRLSGQDVQATEKN